MRGAVVCFVLVATLGLSAQEADAPTLAPIAVLRFQAFELEAENITLKIAQLQARLKQLAVDAQTFYDTQKKDGYTLERGQDGWQYKKTPPPPQ